MPVDALLKQKTCCGNGCSNCPYIPRHAISSTKIDDEWVTYKSAVPTASYEDFISAKIRNTR